MTIPITDKFNLKSIPKPADLQALMLNFEKLKEKKLQYLDVASTPIIKEITESIFSSSHYLSEIIIKNFDFYVGLFKNGFEKNFDDIIENTSNLEFENEEELMKHLREQKLKVSLLIAIAEITNLWAVEETTEKLSIFADLSISKTCEFLLKDAHNKSIIKLKNPQSPLYESGLVIIAIGKLGSYELNYSSDIDLSVFYEDEKLEYLGRKTLAQFYIELAQNLTKILSDRTRDGYVFRVDMRLRPDPGSNPLAVSLKKAEKYYFTVGQNWERAAYTRYRFICGDKDSGNIFSEFMDKNVWRISLDFETIEDIHSIKRQIDTKQGLHPDNLYGYNVKLGKGGIREIEFFCQTQQLIWGGRKPKLRKGNIIEALASLSKQGEIKQKTAEDMTDAYLSYRLVEHRLQMINDEQTHTLPTNKKEMNDFALFCGFENEKSFLTALHKKINCVRKHYSKLFETSPTLASTLPQASGSLIFTGTENHPDTIATLTKMGFKNPNQVSDIVRGWHHGRIAVTTKKRARAELTKLMPYLFTAFAKSSDPDEAFIHFDEFLSRQPEASQIFSMLYVNPKLLELLAEIFGGYPEIADSLSKNPDLIEYVLARDFYKALPSFNKLHKELLKELKPVKNDIDKAMEVIKKFANDMKFRVGIQLVQGEISTERVFLNLSNIAEVVTRVVLDLAKKDFEKQFGKINGGKFAIIAFGKLGSKELTFNSDLDLVFVYDFNKENPKIPASSYYIKFAGMIISLLSSLTQTGKLYEVDSRLRPLGESGPLSCSLKSFNEYYNPGKEGGAWVFEYIALTRARAISQDKKFENELQKLIKQKLIHEWDTSLLHKYAVYIYEKFHQTKKQENILDIKNAEGGLFDLEFMVRFLQLKHLYDYPGIHSFSTSKAIDNIYNKKLINHREYMTMKNAYNIYKEIQNILRITSEKNINSYTEKLLCKLLKSKNNTTLYKKLEETKNTVKNLVKKFLF